MSVSYRHTSHVIGLSLLLFCLALILTAYSARHPGMARLGTAVVSEALSPVQAVNRALHRTLYGFWDRYIALIATKKENYRLKDRLAVLEAENSRLLELESENSRLRGLLDVQESHLLAGIFARVIAYDPSNWGRVVTIDKGTADGIAEGLAVIEGNGVVGQVMAAGVKSARVLLLTDPSSGVDAIIQASRSRGVAEGTGSKTLRLSYVLAEEEVKMGDRVITSGMGGVFPKGLLIGVVSDMADRESGKLFHDIKIRSSVDFTKLESVLVVKKSG